MSLVVAALVMVVVVWCGCVDGGLVSSTGHHPLRPDLRNAQISKIPQFGMSFQNFKTKRYLLSSVTIHVLRALPVDHKGQTENIFPFSNSISSIIICQPWPNPSIPNRPGVQLTNWLDQKFQILPTPPHNGGGGVLQKLQKILQNSHKSHCPQRLAPVSPLSPKRGNKINFSITAVTISFSEITQNPTKNEKILSKKNSKVPKNFQWCPIV